MDSSSHFIFIGVAVVIFIVALVLKKTASPSSKKPSSPLKASNKSKDKDNKKEEDKGPQISYGQINLYFGSQTGTASNFCKTLAAEAVANQFKPVIIDLQDFDPETFVKAQVALFCMANHGEGEPTDNAMKFFEWLSSEDRTEETLKKLRFSVFGLGNRQYQFFNAIGKKTNAFFEKYGGERIYRYGEGDDDGSLEDDFTEWKTDLWKELKTKITPVSSDETKKPVDEFPFKIIIGDSDVKELDLENFNAEADGKEYDFQTKTFLGCKEIRINKADELRQNNEEGSTLHVEFDLANSGITYTTAANLFIFPENDPQLVSAMADLLKLPLEQIFTIEENKDQQSSIKFKHPVPSPISVKTYLSRFCDLQGPVRKSALKDLAKYVSDADLKEKLNRLASTAGRTEFEEEITKPLKGLYHLLVDNKIELTLQQLLTIADNIKPRYFTIASSSLKDPNCIHICASLLEIKVAEKWRPGMVSGYLKRVQSQIRSNPDAIVKGRVNVRDSSFYLPTDSERPLVLVGPGAGLAPFRGFLLEKEFLLQKGENKHWGDVTLYFGCRKPHSDHIYKDELERHHKEGIINKYYTAYSRETEKVVYVQDLMKEHTEELIQTLFDRSGVVYICGSIRMGNDVVKVITQLVATHYKVSILEAAKRIKVFEQERKIIKELWE